MATRSRSSSPPTPRELGSTASKMSPSTMPQPPEGETMAQPLATTSNLPPSEASNNTSGGFAGVPETGAFGEFGSGGLNSGSMTPNSSQSTPRMTSQPRRWSGASDPTVVAQAQLAAAQAQGRRPSADMDVWDATSGQPPAQMCRHYLEGKCTYGVACKFSHGNDDVGPRVVVKTNRRCSNSSQGTASPVSPGLGSGLHSPISSPPNRRSSLGSRRGSHQEGPVSPNSSFVANAMGSMGIDGEVQQTFSSRPKSPPLSPHRRGSHGRPAASPPYPSAGGNNSYTAPAAFQHQQQPVPNQQQYPGYDSGYGGNVSPPGQMANNGYTFPSGQ